MGLSALAWNDLKLPRVGLEGRYEALLPLDAGGMAEVFVGLHRGALGARRLVVIKLIRSEILDDQEYTDMFVDEARIAIRLSHPNVVHTYDVVDDPPALVMEFLDGQSLLKLLNTVGRGKVSLPDQVWILTELLEALHYAHRVRDLDGTPLGLIHRDVSPSNVFVCYDGTVKLLDFGIAKGAGAIVATRDGILKGKMGYVSPEQCLGEVATAQSDIYAVGVMLWEAMARRRRLSGSTLAAQVRARIEGLEPPVEQIWPEAPPALAEIAGRALHSEPACRYPSARAMQKDLQAYLASVGSSAGPGSVSLLCRSCFKRERAMLHDALGARLAGEQFPRTNTTPLSPTGAVSSPGVLQRAPALPDAGRGPSGPSETSYFLSELRPGPPVFAQVRRLFVWALSRATGRDIDRWLPGRRARLRAAALMVAVTTLATLMFFAAQSAQRGSITEPAEAITSKRSGPPNEAASAAPRRQGNTKLACSVNSPPTQRVSTNEAKVRSSPPPATHAKRRVLADGTARPSATRTGAPPRRRRPASRVTPRAPPRLPVPLEVRVDPGTSLHGIGGRPRARTINEQNPYGP